MDLILLINVKMSTIIFVGILAFMLKKNDKIFMSFLITRRASYLKGGSLMWMMPQHLHVNQNTDYDEKCHVHIGSEPGDMENLKIQFSIYCSSIIGPQCEKTWLCFICITKVQTGLCIGTVWLVPLLFTPWEEWYLNLFHRIFQYFS